MSDKSPASPEPEDDLVQMTKDQFDQLVSQISASFSTPSLPPSTSTSIPGSSTRPTFTKSGLEKQFTFNSSVLSVLTPALDLVKEDETKDCLRRAITLLTQRNELLTVADTDPEVFDFFDKQSKADAMQLTNPILAAFIREKKKKEEKKPVVSRGSGRVTGHIRSSPFGPEGRHGPPPLFLTRRPSMDKVVDTKLAVTPQGFKDALGTCVLTAGAMDTTPGNVKRSANKRHSKHKKKSQRKTFSFTNFLVMCRRRQPMREIEGAAHQAEVGDDLYDISEAANERDRDVQLWGGSDCHLTKSQIRKYMVEAEKNNMPPEKAHEILAYCKFDTSKALKICQDFVVPDLLSDYEKRVVQCAVRGEKFDMLSVPDPSQRSRLLKDLLPQQSRRTIMDYYYKSKHNNFEFECRMDYLSPTEQLDVSGNGDAPNK